MPLLTITPPYAGTDYGAQGPAGPSAGTFRILAGPINPNLSTDASVGGAAVGSLYSVLGGTAGAILFVRVARGTNGSDWTAIA